MLSMPPATTTSTLPARNRSWPRMGACMPDPHILFRGVQTVDLARQAAALDRCANRRSTELRGGNTGKFTLEGTHGRAGTPDDDNWILLHRGLLSVQPCAALRRDGLLRHSAWGSR